jgi:uncharacterized coiled-coil DUF342 family protein
MSGTDNIEVFPGAKSNSDLQKEIKKYENINNKLVILLDEVSINTEKYANNKIKIEKLIAQADKFYEKIFVPTRNKINDPVSGLSSVFKKSQQQYSDINSNIIKINKSYSSYLDILKNIQKILTTAKLTDKKINTSLAKSEKTVDSILVIRDSVRGLYKDVSEIKTQSGDANTKINSCYSESVDKCKKIDTNLERSDSTIKDMVVLEAEAKDFVQKIADQYGIASNTSLAGAFEEKKGKLVQELKDWHLRVRNWSLILFVAIVSLFLVQWLGSDKCDLNDLKFDFYLRFLFVTPLLFYLLFCAGQYNRTRINLDKYSFKAAIARSLEAHADLLSRNFSDPAFKDRVLEFSLTSLGKIYDKPYIDDVEMAKVINVKNDCNKGSEKILTDLLLFDKSETLKLLKSITSILEKKS